MAGLFPRWRGRSATAQAAAPVVEPTPAPPLPRPASLPHHWLTLLVARAGPHEALPAPDARIVVRPYPAGSTRPGEPIARGTTGADGALALLLPAGRYAVAAAHQGDGKCVTITLEHAGRATLLLEAAGRRVTLTVDASGPDGRALANADVELRALPGGTVATRGVTDERGLAPLRVPPGAYEVRIGDASARTYVEADTVLRLAVGSASPSLAPLETGYASKVRHATTYTARFDPEAVRDDVWN